LTHQGIVQKFDWGPLIKQQKKANQLHWAAFFGDVDHEIEQVWIGARVTLTYLLRRGASDAPPRAGASEDVAPRVLSAWRALLADKSLLPRGGTLGYPCTHLYHQDARFQRKQSQLNGRSARLLKGRDYLVAATALEAGLQVHFVPYLFEDCADGIWQLNRFPTAKEKAKLGWQVATSDLEDALPIRAGSDEGDDFGVTWLEDPPSSDRTAWQSATDEDRQLPSAAQFHHCDYCPWGYFGNESSEVDLYTFAALHIEVPRLGQGPRAATKQVKAPARGRSSRKKAK
jgi:hypothetical protein